MKKYIIIALLFASCNYNKNPKYKKGDILYLIPSNERVLILDVNINGEDYEYSDGHHNFLRCYCSEVQLSKQPL